MQNVFFWEGGWGVGVGGKQGVLWEFESGEFHRPLTAVVSFNAILVTHMHLLGKTVFLSMYPLVQLCFYLKNFLILQTAVLCAFGV